MDRFILSHELSGSAFHSRLSIDLSAHSELAQ